MGRGGGGSGGGGLQWGSRREIAGHKLCFGHISGTPAPSCLGNSACKYSHPGIVPQKGPPILLEEEKTVQLYLSLWKTDLDEGGAENTRPGLI